MNDTRAQRDRERVPGRPALGGWLFTIGIIAGAAWLYYTIFFTNWMGL